MSLMPILVMNGILLVITVLLALADRLLVTYGDCKVTVTKDDETNTFTVQGGDYLHASLKECGVSVSSSCGGKATCGYCKVRVLSVAPSLDTPVCATQTRTFNQEAVSLSADVVILSVSLDLPFALGRFCGAKGIERVMTTSDYRYRSFGEAYGVHIRELGLLSRAVFVIDRNDKIVHAEYVREVTNEPDYAAALAAVKAAL